MHARDQRTQFLALLRPAANDDFLAGPGLGLDPAADAAAAVGCAELLGDDALEAHAAGRLQDRVAVGLEMVDVTDLVALVLGTGQQFPQPRLALAERQWSQVLVAFEQKIEDEEDQVLRVAFG